MNLSQPSRRTFLSSTAAGAVALSPGLSALLADTGSTPRGFKVGVCEWNLGKNDPSSYDLAKEIGVDGIQLNMGSVGNDMHLRRPDVQKAYLAAAKKHGLEVASVGVAEMNNVPLKSDPRAETWLHDSVGVAKALGVKVVLLAFFHKNDLKGDKAGTDRVVDLLKQATPRAQEAGVVYGIESWLSAEEHMDIIDRVASPALQVYYDVGNSHLKDYDIYREIRWLGRKNICEFHAKDYNFLFGQGKVDFPEVRRAMDDIGYRGWIQIEGAQPLGMIESYKQDRQYLKTVFPPAA